MSSPAMSTPASCLLCLLLYVDLALSESMLSVSGLK